MTWFITGTSVGFGRELVLALLARRIPVAASARRLDSISDLAALGAHTVEWDVTWPLERQQAAAREIDAKVPGGVDVVVNNAGFMIAGTTEMTTPEDDQKIFATNVFGLMNTTRAFLPLMRERKAGTIVNMSSIAGLRGGAGFPLYAATKFAVEGFTESLAQEIAHLGLRAIVISPGYFRTNFLTQPPPSTGTSLDAYDPVMQPLLAGLAAYNGHQPGDPKKGVNVIIDVVLRKGKLPVRLALGKDGVKIWKEAAERDLALAEEWGDLVGSTDHDDVAA